ncbi:hypothetical protein Cgig2_006388 [Carnegiea gigantea]|uniref:Uncharacterized protein n=1 Tax=Carnegiea gigantea TaxID=171969 RepID=A0A9Q1QC01_9CARY|nr:hypothetical protein Cgig2_006388 [Carnegiea gigantea]
MCTLWKNHKPLNQKRHISVGDKNEENKTCVKTWLKTTPNEIKKNMLEQQLKKRQRKSPKQQANTNIGLQDLKLVQKLVETDTKQFVAMIDKFNEAQKQAMRDMGFGGFPELQVTELLGDLCKWLVDNFYPYSVTLYIVAEKKIEIKHQLMCISHWQSQLVEGRLKSL